MWYCPPPTGPVASECTVEVDITFAALVWLAEDEALFEIDTSEPTSATGTITASDGTRIATINSGTHAEHVYLLRDIPCVDSMTVDMVLTWVSPYGDGTVIELPFNQTYDIAADVGCTPYTLDSVTASPSTLHRGDWLTVSFSGSGFGPTSEGEAKFYDAYGNLLVSLPGTFSGDPNIDMVWADDEVRVSFGPVYTSTYPLGWFPFKGRISTRANRANGDTDVVWSGFNVVQ